MNKSQLQTPEGESAQNMDKVMLLALWTRKLTEERPNEEFCMGAMGKPSFPVNWFATQKAGTYWQNLTTNALNTRTYISSHGLNESKHREFIAREAAAVDYGDPRGHIDARTKVANALTEWYSTDEKRIIVAPDNILFTVGGAGALFCTFDVFNYLRPKGRIVTPFPYYSLYQGHRGQNRLHPINVMEQPGYKLTAKALQQSIDSANALGEIDGGKVSAFIFSDPNNPLGTHIEKEEMLSIIAVLEKYPEIYIIIDGAYEEMRLDARKHESLLCFAPPEMLNRIILLRSATKALSLAGERMAILVAFDSKIMAELLKTNIDMFGHAPISAQIAFAEAMNKLDDHELRNLVAFYKPQVELITERLQAMGAAMPDPTYKTTGTFYVVADLSDLFGMQMPEDAKRALPMCGQFAKTDEELAYALMFKDSIILCPLSYFGIHPKKGFFRITCSTGDKKLNLLMDRLEARLTEVRSRKYDQLAQQVNELLAKLAVTDTIKTKNYSMLFREFTKRDYRITDAIHFKNCIHELKKLISKIRYNLEEEKEYAATKIQAFFRGIEARRIAKEEYTTATTKWVNFITAKFPDESPDFLHTLFARKVSERNIFGPWKKHLEKQNREFIEQTDLENGLSRKSILQ